MLQNGKIWMAQGDNPCYLLLNQANRHGLIAGASGTGKTVTLKVMAEGFSQAGVPVFMADVKGDVTGMCQAGVDSESMQKRRAKFGLENFTYQGCPTHIWDMTDEDGVPVRVTISDMGPVLLSRLLGLTKVQEGVLNIVFRIADDKQMLLIDLKDLRSMLTYVSEHAKEYTTTYGNVSSQSVGAILRALIAIEDQGGDLFFGEPAPNFQIGSRAMRTDTATSTSLTRRGSSSTRKFTRCSCCGCFPTFSKSCPKSETRTSPNSSSSSMRPICFLTACRTSF